MNAPARVPGESRAGRRPARWGGRLAVAACASAACASAALALAVFPVLATAHAGRRSTAPDADGHAERVAVGLTGETGIEGGESYRLPDDLLLLLASPDALPAQNTGRSMKLLGPRALARRVAKQAGAEAARGGRIRGWTIPSVE